jgi:glycerol-3-phosphate dehydrogenase
VRRYGAEADEVEALESECLSRAPLESREPADPEGFPCLRGQFLYQLRHGAVLRLEDFYRRRVPLYLARADHGLPWAEALSWIWAWELQRSEAERLAELKALREALTQS